MTKQVLFGRDARDKMLEGIKKITNAVRVTMGGSGKCVLIGNGVYGNDGLVQLPTLVTKDGYNVTKHFQLEDLVENRGALLIKEAALKTVEQAGDATTCTCILSENLISNGVDLINEGANSQEIKKGMDNALEDVLKALKEISVPLKGDIDRIRQVATVSANNDSYIGNLIAEAYSKIGDDGIIDIEESKGVETEIKVSDGYRFERGWLSPLFVNERAKETCEFENPLILLYQHRITHHTQIEKALSFAMSNNRPLLIICEDVDEAGLGFLGMNNIQGRIKVCAVKSPEFGDARRDWMEDIAISTGATYISDLRGLNIKEVKESHFGSAKKVIVSKTETVVIGGNSDKDVLEDFVNDLKMNLAQAKTEEEKYPIEKRIARLTGGVAVIYVGAATETELREKIDRVDDAVRATKAAITEGYVAGGGTAFLRILNKGVGDTTDFNKGRELVYESLSSPLKQICANAGLDSSKILVDVKNAGKTVGRMDGTISSVAQTWGGINYGYNVLTNEIVDMVEEGIIDSTKALRCALTNAVSVAGMFLTSECAIITIH